MRFSKPIWYSNTKRWNIDMYETNEYNYFEIRSISTNDNFFSDPDINTTTFKKCIEKLTKEIIVQGKIWFASPIKEEIFLKRVSHNFEKISNANIYGTNSLISWTLNKLVIYSTGYELYWSTSVEDYKEPIQSNIVEELRVNFIEPEIQTLEIEELKEIPSTISSEIGFDFSSRAIYKKKVRDARLKAAIATMKAEKMAEKYFRRYGNQINFEYESELSSSEE